MLTCTLCRIEKLPSRFYFNSMRRRHFRRCIECISTINKFKYLAKNPVKYNCATRAPLKELIKEGKYGIKPSPNV